MAVGTSMTQGYFIPVVVLIIVLIIVLTVAARASATDHRSAASTDAIRLRR